MHLRLHRETYGILKIKKAFVKTVPHVTKYTTCSFILSVGVRFLKFPYIFIPTSRKFELFYVCK